MRHQPAHQVRNKEENNVSKKMREKQGSLWQGRKKIKGVEKILLVSIQSLF